MHARRWSLAGLLCAGTALAQDAPAEKRPWPGAERAALEIPADLWDEAIARTVPARRPLGYTGDEMRNYGGREHLLRTVDNLFRDARAIPRDTGRITDDLLKLAGEGKVDEVVQRCWGLTDVPAGRNFPEVPRDGWGTAAVPKDATAAQAFGSLWSMSWTGVGQSDRRFDGSESPLPREPEIAAFETLTDRTQRALARLSVGAAEAHRWTRWTVPMDARQLLGPELMRQLAAKRAMWAGVWKDEQFDQTATRSHTAFEDLAKVDRAQLAYASVIFAAHLRTAVAELRDAASPAPQSGAPTEPRVIRTLLGPVVVTGPGPDVIDASKLPEGTWCVLDEGGDDRWIGAFGSPSVHSFAVAAIAIDLGGNDVWEGDEYALGCGMNGVGVVVDIAGDDRYTVKESGLGCGWFGTGLLWDLAGNDTYAAKKWAQGAAHAGVGVLLDVAGDDRYECDEQSQGMGSTLGCGLLLDLAGNDVYHCRDDGNVSELYLGQSVAMAQGCGYGRRADLGDGRSLAGGWGLLVDGAGDDRYHAQCWAQGCGYWWGVGVLEDRGGNDVYENGKYSLGAAAHFAVGVHVDLAGDDRYNVGVATTKNQFQGHARDGSIGISVDGDGNDRYALKNLCAGCADLGSIAVFWDRRGDDEYAAAMEKGLGDTGPFGTATTYPPYRSFRDDLPAVGLFFDTGGTDVYRGDPRNDGADASSPLVGAGDGSTWSMQRGPASAGFGTDRTLW